MKATVLLIVLLVGLAAGQSFVVREDFSDGKCSTPVFEQVTPTGCTMDAAGRYTMYSCDTSAITFSECTDNMCKTCPRSEKFNLTCTSFEGGNRSMQYQCASAFPTAANTITQVTYPETNGGCKGAFAVGFVSFDFSMCRPSGGDHYSKQQCNSDGTVTSLHDCTDAMCTTGCATEKLNTCTHENNGWSSINCTASTFF
jgi:hypothetical protein